MIATLVILAVVAVLIVVAAWRKANWPSAINKYQRRAPREDQGE